MKKLVLAMFFISLAGCKEITHPTCEIQIFNYDLISYEMTTLINTLYDKGYYFEKSSGKLAENPIGILRFSSWEYEKSSRWGYDSRSRTSFVVSAEARFSVIGDYSGFESEKVFSVSRDYDLNRGGRYELSYTSKEQRASGVLDGLLGQVGDLIDDIPNCVIGSE